ncbi:MAG: TIGR02301 family protein [Alphaproteobacteria bacterium]
MRSRVPVRLEIPFRRLVSAGRIALAAALFLNTAIAAPPPYANDLERLAEILGSLQFLAEICDDGSAGWRQQMTELLGQTDPEADAEWRARLTDRFNLGYSSFAAVYRSCTSAAMLAIEQYRMAGAQIAGDIAAEYGALPLLEAPNGEAP